LAFKSGEDGDEFALRLTSLRQQMEQHSDYDITEERAITKFPRSSPLNYLQLKITIQMMLDISTLTIEEVTTLRENLK
jgi:CRP-like cAMP-binding protein